MDKISSHAACPSFVDIFFKSPILAQFWPIFGHFLAILIPYKILRVTPVAIKIYILRLYIGIDVCSKFQLKQPNHGWPYSFDIF